VPVATTTSASPHHPSISPETPPPHCTRRPSQLNLQLNLRSVTCRNFPAFHFNISNFFSTVRCATRGCGVLRENHLHALGKFPAAPLHLHAALDAECCVCVRARVYIAISIRRRSIVSRRSILGRL